MDPLAHASIALMARPLAPEAPLWALVAATQVPDALFFAFEAAGLERQAKTRLDFKHGLAYLSPPHIPWSHGLFMTVVWSGVVGGLAHLFTRNRRAGVAAGLMVFSHWLLDFTVYPNMPVLFDDSRVTGLGLITSQAGFIAGSLLEVALIAGGVSAAARHWKASQSVKTQ
jgi:membrane-bound metal-dependent hydrolase YbcI (DUF457 family)